MSCPTAALRHNAVPSFIAPSHVSTFLPTRILANNTSPTTHKPFITPNPPKRSRLVRMTQITGWPVTRLKIRNETPLMAEPPLPGVYFANPPRMTIDDLLGIILAKTPDDWVNEIVRTFLGWRQMENGEWNDDLVPLQWKKVYNKGPPDFIGKAGDYSPEKDRPVKLAIQNLSRSVPKEGKQLLKPTLRPYGWAGWRVEQLTPNLTRRAQAVNFILYWYKSHYPDYIWTRAEQLDTKKEET